MALKVRALTIDEQTAIEQLVHARTAPARAVERARIVWFASQGQRVPAIAVRLGIGPGPVRLWLKRFNEQGLAGLHDRPRSGHPRVYTTEHVGEIIATALTEPPTLDLPFACWSLDRLQDYLSAQKGIAMKRSRINQLLLAEGLRWREQETWFGERVDPDFAQKRGSSPNSTLSRRSTALSSV
jgi:transposase